MIRTPTTFVIGAGASRPYYFPTGPELLTQATELSPSSPLYQLILQTNAISRTQLNAVLDDLRQHVAPSIDAFLESRQDDPITMKAGRLIIASLMGEATHSARARDLGVSDPGEDWLQYVVEQMRTGAPKWLDFANGNRAVRFVTFNFDDVIETRLTRGLLSIYRGRITQSDVLMTLGNFPVIHVHGKLPPIPATPLQGSHRGMPQEWANWLAEAASHVHVVLDEIEAGVLQQARDAIDQAQVICFLGFAYADENLRGRLHLPDRVQGKQVDIFGSAKGLRDGRRAQITMQFVPSGPRIVLGDINKNCRDVLLDFHIFRD